MRQKISLVVSSLSHSHALSGSWRSHFSNHLLLCDQNVFPEFWLDCCWKLHNQWLSVEQPEFWDSDLVHHCQWQSLYLVGCYSCGQKWSQYITLSDIATNIQPLRLAYKVAMDGLKSPTSIQSIQRGWPWPLSSFTWFLPNLAYLSMQFILELTSTAHSTGQLMKIWHA